MSYVSHDVVTKNLHDLKELEELVKEYDSSLEIGKSYSETYWDVYGNNFSFTIYIERFSAEYYVQPDRIKRLLHIDHDPYVVKFTRASGDIELIYRSIYNLMVLVKAKFGGFFDYDGRIITQIYPDCYVDEEGNEYDKEGNEYSKGLGNEELIYSVDLNIFNEEYQRKI